MADESIGIQLARMEGKIDRVGDAQRRSESDITDMRTRTNGIADVVSRLDNLNIQDRLIAIGGRLDKHENQLDECEADRNRRAGALGMAKFMWAASGAAGGVGTVIVAHLLGVH